MAAANEASGGHDHGPRHLPHLLLPIHLTHQCQRKLKRGARTPAPQSSSGGGRSKAGRQVSAQAGGRAGGGVGGGWLALEQLLTLGKHGMAC